MVWVPSHCGLDRNDLVVCLAKQALQLPMDRQITVAVDYADVKRRARSQVRCIPIIEEIPRELEGMITLREAEVVLSQLAVGRISCLHPLGTYLKRRRLVCTCRPGMLNDGDRYVLRCPMRTRSQRLCFPSMRERQGMGLFDIIKRWPERMLVYLARERFFFLKRSALRRN